MVSRAPGGSDPLRDPEEALLREISARISSRDFETWFRHLPMRVVPPDQVIISAANKFSRNWLDRKFKEIIAASAGVVLGTLPRVDIVLPGCSVPPKEDGSAPAPARPDEEIPSLANRTFIPPPDRRPQFLPSAPRPPVSRTTILSSAPINRDFTFSNFVIGPSNRLAHAAALGITEAPGRTYNPFFIYGGVGLGKTHLLHAIVHRLQKVPGLSITYLTSEAFTNHFISAIEHGNVEGFRASLRSTDVLIVDDVQFISTRERTQEEFFHTFNSLIAEAKQVVISSDCAPKEIPGLKERLASRFSMGLLTRIDPPGFETRVAIILKKARARGRDIPEPVAEYIAQRIESNIRELEGAIVRLFGLASLQEGSGAGDLRPITTELARAALKEMGSKEGPGGTMGVTEILKAVAHFYDVKLAELSSKRRARTVSFARQVSMFLARQLTHCSLQEIGAYLGGRDHTTVIYSIERIESYSRNDPRIKADLELIKTRILGARNAF